jgi:hypothetical protein
MDEKMTPEEQKVFLKTVGEFILEQIAKATEPLAARIAALESTGIKYCGAYQRAGDYARGSVVTYDASMWVAVCTTPPMEVPGKSLCWQLCVKSQRAPTTQPREYRS